MSVVNPKYGYIFLHEPRTGGRSIEAALMKHEDSYNFDGLHHISAVQMVVGKYLTNEQFHRFTKFRVIRNPYDWLATVHAGYAHHCALEDWVLSDAAKSFMLNGTLFWRYYSIADFELKFENLEAGVNAVLEECGAPEVELPHLGKTENKIDWEKLTTGTVRGMELVYPDITVYNYNIWKTNLGGLFHKWR